MKGDGMFHKIIKGLMKILVLAAVIAGIVYYTRPAAREPGDVNDNELLSAVRSFTAKKRDLVIKVVQSGTLKASRSLVFTSEIKSNRAKIISLAKDGGFVNEGDLLFKFDQTPFLDKIQNLESDLEEAQTSLISANEELEYSNAKFNEDLNLAEQKIEMALLYKKNVYEGEGALDLERAKSKIKSAELSLEEAQLSLENLEKMFEKGFVTKAEIEKAGVDVKNAAEALYFAKKENELLVNHTYPIDKKEAENGVAKARDYLDKLKKKHLHEVNSFKAKIQQAKNRVRSVKTQIRSAKSELEKTEIYAPISGFVVHTTSYHGGKMRRVQLGDAIWSNQEVMMIPDTSKMLVESRIREADIYKVSLDQNVDIRVDAYPDLDLKGKITLVGALAKSSNPAKDGQGQPKYFNLDVEILNNDDRLRPGMTARVEIIVDELIQAVTLPVQAVFSEEYQSYCYLKAANGYRKVKVMTGDTDDEFVELTKGIDAGDTVFLPEEIKTLEAKRSEREFSLIRTLGRIFSNE